MKLHNKSLRFVPLGAFTAVALTAGHVGAATIIPIANDGFELPGGAGFPQATSWTSQAGTALHTDFVRPNSTGLGLRFGFTNPQTGTEQTIPVAYVANLTYTFKSFGVASSTPNSDLRYILGYDPGSGFVELAQATYDLNSITAWTELAGVSTTIGGSSPAIGRNIIVRIRGVGAVSEGVWFDNASLTSVPEPSAALLGGLGVLALLRRRR